MKGGLILPAKKVKNGYCEYGDLNRGTSISIPVFVRNEFDKPLNLSNYKIVFTAKEEQYDYDRKDSKAIIQKILVPQVAEQGEFYIELSSFDLDLEPKRYYFDICLFNEKGAISRLVNGDFNIVGGPTNILVTRQFETLAYGDGIYVYLKMGKPIVCVAPSIQIATPDKELYSQMANVLNAVDTYKSKVEELEETIETLKTQISNLTTGGEGFEG